MRKIWGKLFAVGIALLGLILAGSIQVSATNVSIDSNLSITPSIISFETTFPGEIHFKPLNINLSNSFIKNAFLDDVEYKIVQKPKPRKDDAKWRAHCEKNPADLKNCYPSLCPYLSKTPDENPKNDKGVPAFHDPTLPSSIAYGKLAKSEKDLVDAWVIDLHVPCFKGECDQTDTVPLRFQLDPKFNGEKFGCDLEVKVTEISYLKKKDDKKIVHGISDRLEGLRKVLRKVTW